MIGARERCPDCGRLVTVRGYRADGTPYYGGHLVSDDEEEHAYCPRSCRRDPTP